MAPLSVVSQQDVDTDMAAAGSKSLTATLTRKSESSMTTGKSKEKRDKKKEKKEKKDKKERKEKKRKLECTG